MLFLNFSSRNCDSKRGLANIQFLISIKQIKIWLFILTNNTYNLFLTSYSLFAFINLKLKQQ